MAVYTHFEVPGSPAADWLSVLTQTLAAIPVPPFTELVLSNSDGSRTHAFGTFTFSLPSTYSGTITSLTRTDAGGTVYEELTGLAVDINTFVNSIDPLGLVLAGNDTFNGWSGIDNLAGLGGNDTMNGAGGNDILSGGIGDDFLNGGANNDVLAGGPGIDTATYLNASAGVTVSLAKTAAQNTIGSGFDTLTGIEKLTGSAFADKLTGNNSANTLSGLAGIDTITGGLGKDIMTGGAQRDIFDFNTKLESGKTATTRDVITDFSHGVDDIDLRTIDANTSKAGDQAFRFIGQAAFHDAGVAEVRFQFVGTTKTIVSADINGDGSVDFQIELTGHRSLSAGDFLL